MKHFPGDGIDERDQHVVTSYNTCGYDEWDAHLRAGVPGDDRHGVQSIMVGHIGAPELSRQLPARASRTRRSCPPPWPRNCSRTCSAASSASTA